MNDFFSFRAQYDIPEICILIDMSDFTSVDEESIHFMATNPQVNLGIKAGAFLISNEINKLIFFCL